MQKKTFGTCCTAPGKSCSRNFREVFRSFREVFRSFRKVSEAFGHVQTHSDPFGPAGTHSDAFGRIWKRPDIFEKIRIFGPVFDGFGRNLIKNFCPSTIYEVPVGCQRLRVIFQECRYLGKARGVVQEMV